MPQPLEAKQIIHDQVRRATDSVDRAVADLMSPHPPTEIEYAKTIIADLFESLELEDQDMVIRHMLHRNAAKAHS